MQRRRSRQEKSGRVVAFDLSGAKSWSESKRGGPIWVNVVRTVPRELCNFLIVNPTIWGENWDVDARPLVLASRVAFSGIEGGSKERMKEEWDQSKRE